MGRSPRTSWDVLDFSASIQRSMAPVISDLRGSFQSEVDGCGRGWETGPDHAKVVVRIYPVPLCNTRRGSHLKVGLGTL